MGTVLKKEKIHNLLQVTARMNHIRDIEALLDRILFEARAFTAAEAGSIYLVEDGRLHFRYVQNDVLMRTNADNHYLYVNHELPIDERSIAGYVALSQRPLLIDDVYTLNPAVPYRFNRSFDKSSAYHTQAMMTLPLITSRGTLIGVLQLINPHGEGGGVIPFSREDEMYAMHFAGIAAGAIEKAMMTREIILRMIRMAELRDPAETGAHVNRVGAYCIEIYRKWATDRRMSAEEITRTLDILRIAAMLHDVGKVAISDVILKKHARLEPEEYEQMKLHTVFGARLFSSTSDWDDMAAEISLNHHEHWDGSGYPGHIADIHAEPVRFGPGKRGAEIPLPARIVALADVYDALMVPRCYKQAWSEEEVLAHLREQSGRYFDPEIVAAFFAIYDVIRAIRNRYS